MTTMDSQQKPVIRVDKGYFADRSEVFADIAETGFWPTTYVSNASPELPVHWHDGDTIGYVIAGETYVLDGDGAKTAIGPGDRLVIPAGALHAEGAVTEPVTYIVTTRKPVPFLEAFRTLDPAAYPEPRLLPLPAEVIAAFNAP